MSKKSMITKSSRYLPERKVIGRWHQGKYIYTKTFHPWLKYPEDDALNLPDPEPFIDRKWAFTYDPESHLIRNSSRCNKVLTILRKAPTLLEFSGRFEMCSRCHGTHEVVVKGYEDGPVWNHVFIHEIREHGIKPPDSFIRWLLSKSK